MLFEYICQNHVSTVGNLVIFLISTSLCFIFCVFQFMYIFLCMLIYTFKIGKLNFFLNLKSLVYGFTHLDVHLCVY